MDGAGDTSKRFLMEVASAINFPAGIYYDGKGTTFVIVMLYLFWGSIFLHIFDRRYYYFSWSFLMLLATGATELLRRSSRSRSQWIGRQK